MAINFDHTTNSITTPDGNISSYKGKNVVINGNFDIWQRGTSFTSIAAGTYSADRWVNYNSTAAVYDISRSTDVPTYAQSGVKSNYSLHVDVTTPDVSIAAADLAEVAYIVEGYDYAQLTGGDATLSFWVKATKTGIYCATVKNAGTTTNARSYTQEYTVALSNTWQKVELTIPLTNTAGTWNYTNGAGLYILFALAAGTNWHATADTWYTGDAAATSNQVNAMESTANNFRIAQVQLERGEVATPFELRHINDELALCQRYYEKSYDLDVDPGTVSLRGSSRFFIDGLSANTHNGGMDTKFRVSKRNVPTIVAYSPDTGTSGKVYDAHGTADITANIDDQADSGFLWYGTGGSASATSVNNCMQWTADAEL